MLNLLQRSRILHLLMYSMVERGLLCFNRRYLDICCMQGLASADHTTLLLNCYTKLKDIEKLDKFLKAGLGDQPTPQFDVDTAIKANFFFSPTRYS